MNRLLRSLLFAVVVVAFAKSSHAAQTKLASQNFTLPDGFEIELVAGTNLVQRPVSAGFDDQGRLYVTDSSGSNEKPSEQLKNPSHRVLRLEDSDGDGRFDKSVVFADKVMFPQGCLWHDGSVYVAGPPSIWKFTDTNNDGVADQREEWFKGGTLTGCANDIHGPHLGPDGYLYWTKGAFDEQTHKLGNGRVLKDRAAHIYRARPDGSDLDVMMSGGMDNPVEIAFTAEGEPVFTSTFIDFSQPGYRDGIGHAVYGGVFGKVNGVLDDGRVKRTGPELLHPFAQLGAAAACGLCRYESSVFGSDYRDNLFAALFNLRKVTRHALRLSGATYQSTDSDFVVSDSMDFHPTDVLPDADGSLLIVDTAGWYKLCCPSSQLAKADVLGGIYRVRKKGTPKLLAGDRRAAYQRLARPPSLAGFGLVATVKRGAWNPGTQRPDWFVEVLRNNTPAKTAESAHVARAAAEGIGRLRERSGIPALLAAADATGDTFLETTLVRALIDIAAPAETRVGLKAASPRSQCAALIALDQMDGGDLKAEDVTPFLTASDVPLKQAASWIMGRHAEWSASLAGFFRDRLAEKNPAKAERDELARQLAPHARNPEIQKLLSATLRDSNSSKDAQMTALRAMSQAGLKETPTAWLSDLAAILARDDKDLVRQAVSTARSLVAPKEGQAELAAALLRIARDANASADVRLEAMAAIPGGVSAPEQAAFDFIRENLDPAKPVNRRSAAASVLAKAKLTPEQLLTLADALRSVSPLEMPKLLAVFEKSTDEALGLRVVAALGEAKSSGLRADLVKTTLAKYPASVQAQSEALLNRLNADAAKQKAHLETLLVDVHGKGDIRRGQAIFNSAKAACSACHTIGYQGGKVGPDLTSIGQARSERDLLESIVYPSASFVRSFEPMLVVTKSGDEQSGVIRKDAPDEVVLATGPNTEARIARSDIAEMRPGTVSVMPQGLDEQLTREELADLLAFLKNTRWGPQ